MLVKVTDTETGTIRSWTAKDDITDQEIVLSLLPDVDKFTIERTENVIYVFKIDRKEDE